MDLPMIQMVILPSAGYQAVRVDDMSEAQLREALQIMSREVEQARALHRQTLDAWKTSQEMRARAPHHP